MSRTILVADDDADNRAIARDVLELAGYRVLLAGDGLEALELVDRERPDLILLDLSMPKLDGWEVARRLRRTSGQGRVPLLAFTAHAFVEAEHKAKAAGCDDYLSKPCLPKDILQKVDALLGGKKMYSKPTEALP